MPRYRRKNSRSPIYTPFEFAFMMRIISFFMFCVFVFLAINFWRVQVKQGSKYANLAKENRIRRVIIPARRGNIYDRNNHLLAENRPSYNATITKEDFKANKDILVQKLSPILEMSEKEMVKAVYSKNNLPYMPCKLASDITLEQVVAIEEYSPSLPGLIIEVAPVRYYRYGKYLSHLLGNVGKISEKQYAKWKDSGYIIDDIVGITGVEEAYNRYLRGTHGGMQVQVNNRSFFDEIINIREAVPGNNIHLTVDKKVQDALEEAYKDQTGAAVVMNPNTGEVYGMVSKPDFDPNIFVTKKSQKSVRKLLIDETFPLMNKAIAGEFPSGSVFKIIVGLAALKEKVITVNSKFYCSGVFHLGKRTMFKCWKKTGHGDVDIYYSLQQSCNVFYYNLGKIMGYLPIYNMARSFGLGEKTGVEIKGEKAGIAPSEAWKKERLGESWYGGDSINYSIGQGYLLVTPIQICSMISAVANGGNLYIPYTVSKVTSPDGAEIESFQPQPKRIINLNKKELAIVKEGLLRVVNDSRGTAKKARLKDIKVAGKTGTIQVKVKGKKTTHAWFACYAPAENPEIAMAFLVEFGRSGGGAAAPLAHKVLEAFFYETEAEKQAKEDAKKEVNIAAQIEAADSQEQIETEDENAEQDLTEIVEVTGDELDLETSFEERPRAVTLTNDHIGESESVAASNTTLANTTLSNAAVNDAAVSQETAAA